MRGALCALLATIAATGCLRSTAFRCVDASDCGAAGFCEAIGYCSFASAACTGTGRRFSASAGQDLANACVPPDEPPTGGVDAMIDTMQPVRCPADFAPIAGLAHAYKVLGSLSWDAAATACKMASASAYLAVPGDATELMELASLASPPAWIGLDAQANPGEFVTQNGDPATFLPWQGGEPGPDSEACVAVASLTKIATGVCDVSRVAICECDP